MSPVRIDVHHHVLTPEYVEALAAVGIVEFAGMPFPAWTPDASLAILDRAGIQAAILSLSAPGFPFDDADRRRTLARSLNEFGAQTVARHPERFGSFATLPLPDVEAALDELAYALDILHADGVVLYSNYAGTYLGDARFDPVFAELDRALPQGDRRLRWGQRRPAAAVARRAPQPADSPNAQRSHRPHVPGSRTAPHSSPPSCPRARRARFTRPRR